MWLKEGERNTKFFHRATIQHRHHNQIVRLRKEDGEYMETQREIEDSLTGYFRELLEEPDIP